MEDIERSSHWLRVNFGLTTPAYQLSRGQKEPNADVTYGLQIFNKLLAIIVQRDLSREREYEFDPSFLKGYDQKTIETIHFHLFADQIMTSQDIHLFDPVLAPFLMNQATQQYMHAFYNRHDITDRLQRHLYEHPFQTEVKIVNWADLPEKEMIICEINKGIFNSGAENYLCRDDLVKVAQAHGLLNLSDDAVIIKQVAAIQEECYERALKAIHSREACVKRVHPDLCSLVDQLLS